MKEITAALFMTGGNQAVRLPREFRFEGDTVRIWKEGNRVILEPLKQVSWPAGYWWRLDGLGPLSSDVELPEPLPRSPPRDWILKQLHDE
jgi:antitoxin VapB